MNNSRDNERNFMKKLMAILAALALVAAGAQTASAGDREWATAGKILTGVVAGAVIARAIEPVYVYSTTPCYYTPPPVYVQPAPVVVYRAPVCVQPAPVVVYSAPPVVSIGFGFGHHYHPFHHRR